MDKAERLAQIMFEEDEIRYNNGKNTIYFTKEDFEAEKKIRDKISRKKENRKWMIINLT